MQAASRSSDETPGTFANLVPLQMGFFDRLINIIYPVIYDIYYQAGQFADVRDESR